MKRLMCTVMSLCLLLGVAAAQTKTTAKKSAAKAAPAATAKAAPAGSSHVKAYGPDDMKWSPAPNALPAGAQIAILEGDPMKSGPFTMRLKFPNNYRIPPHSHSKTEHVTVISGNIRVGMGDTFDEKSMTSFSTGSFAAIEPGTHHYGLVKNDNILKGHDTIIQLHGEGPWDIKYVNASDDPRKKK
jgi:ChrR-like protein with cupin domain